MLSFDKLVDLGSAAPHVYVMYLNISNWLTVDYLIAYKVLLTACHICFHQKRTTHLGLHPRGYTPYAQINYVNPLLFLGAYFVFFELTVFFITVFAVCSAVTFAFVICSNNKESSCIAENKIFFCFFFSFFSVHVRPQAHI